MDADVVIIGGGVMGASIAYNLAERGAGRIVLVERDVPGSGSTSKAAGGVRCQFSDEVNIALSVRSLEILRSFESTFGTDIDLVSNGYLFLLDSPESAEMFAANVALQQRLGLDSQMLTVDEVAALAPYVDTTGLVAGAFNPGDGHCTPEPSSPVTSPPPGTAGSRWSSAARSPASSPEVRTGGGGSPRWRRRRADHVLTGRVRGRRLVGTHR